MNSALKVLCICLFSQLALSNSLVITPTTDSIPSKKLKVGLQTKFLSNSSSANAYQFGVSLEKPLKNLLALESEIAVEHKRYDYNRFRLGQANALNLDFALNLKMYFNSDQRWFGKLGYYYNHNLDHQSFQEILPSNAIANRHGFQAGLGYNIIMKNQSRITIEGILRHNRLDGLHGGLKFGFTF